MNSRRLTIDGRNNDIIVSYDVHRYLLAQAGTQKPGSGHCRFDRIPSDQVNEEGIEYIYLVFAESKPISAVGSSHLLYDKKGRPVSPAVKAPVKRIWDKGKIFLGEHAEMRLKEFFKSNFSLPICKGNAKYN